MSITGWVYMGKNWDHEWNDPQDVKDFEVFDVGGAAAEVWIREDYRGDTEVTEYTAADVGEITVSVAPVTSRPSYGL
jgi:hypothetical protein